MKVLRAFTKRSLKQHRSRTWVTIFGILISMTMLTAVTMGGYSCLHYLEAIETEKNGAYHGYWQGLNEQEVEETKRLPNRKALSIWREVGFAEWTNQNEHKPYLRILSIDEEAPKLAAIHLLSGRLPAQPDEIILPDHLQQSGSVRYQEGDLLSLEVGRRVVDGKPALNDPAREEVALQLGQEAIQGKQKKTYRVVGTYHRLSFDLEPRQLPAYTAFTAGPASGPATVLFSFENLGEGIKEIEERGQLIREEVGERNTIFKGNLFYVNYHQSLLLAQGNILNSDIARIVAIFASILIALIVFSTIVLIYDAFSISITERTRQYGLLKSIGATNRQIRHSILYEGLLVSLPAIFFGALVGLAGLAIAFRLLCAYSEFFTTEIYPGHSLSLGVAIRFWPILLAGLLCLMTTLFSALLPALRAMRLTPIAAIRQSQDIRIKGKQVQLSSWQRRLDIAAQLALKNQKRDRKRYRATLFSLIFSVILFVLTTSFTDQLRTQMSAQIDDFGGADLHYGFGYNVSGELAEEGPYRWGREANRKEEVEARYTLAYQERLLGQMKELPSVQSAQLSFTNSGLVRLDAALFHPDYIQWVRQLDPQARKEFGMSEEKKLEVRQWQLGSDPIRMTLPICFLDDEAFHTYARRLRLDPEAFQTGSGFRAILYNVYQSEQRDLPKGQRPIQLPLLKNQKSVTVFYLAYQLPEFMNPDQVELSIPARNQAVYDLPPRENPEGAGKTELRPIRLPAEKVERPKKIEVALMTDQKPLGAGTGSPCLYLPLSKSTSFFTASERRYLDFQGAIDMSAKNHMQASREIEALSKGDHQDHHLYNHRAVQESNWRILVIVRSFITLFVAMMALIAMANMFNAISTSMMLRRREFGVLKSIGMSDRQLKKMLLTEGLNYGLRAMLYSLPLSLLLSYLLYRFISQNGFQTPFQLPWKSLLISYIVIFMVVSLPIHYAKRKLDLDHPMRWLKGENF